MELSAGVGGGFSVEERSIEASLLITTWRALLACIDHRGEKSALR
jgi:hypothetical protein